MLCVFVYFIRKKRVRYSSLEAESDVMYKCMEYVHTQLHGSSVVITIHFQFIILHTYSFICHGQQSLSFVKNLF
jgi:hypothetical protein